MVVKEGYCQVIWITLSSYIGFDTMIVLKRCMNNVFRRILAKNHLGRIHTGEKTCTWSRSYHVIVRISVLIFQFTSKNRIKPSKQDHRSIHITIFCSISWFLSSFRYLVIRSNHYICLLNPLTMDFQLVGQLLFSTKLIFSSNLFQNCVFTVTSI